ncbi:GNAT family N-acetyltransferase [Xanthomonas arboricola]|uniref:GNAT family N-acetyltransferase n=2 Tax=Xanthomonas arboricola TaxID=56448 RepID=UPI000F8E307A|nr:GNAT family N-acetyltransferase [Xanthomonas arboricola]
MHIRQATATRHECIGKILAAAYGPVMQRMTNADATAFAESLSNTVVRYGSSGTWLLAELLDQPVGAVAFFPPGSTKHPLFQGSFAHIQLLGVVPGQTRGGIAQSLMAECFRMAANSGASALLLQTSELMPEARRLYERLGFNLRRQLPPVWGAPTYLYAKSEA